MIKQKMFVHYAVPIVESQDLAEQFRSALYNGSSSILTNQICHLISKAFPLKNNFVIRGGYLTTHLHMCIWLNCTNFTIIRNPAKVSYGRNHKQTAEKEISMSSDGMK